MAAPPGNVRPQRGRGNPAPKGEERLASYVSVAAYVPARAPSAGQPAPPPRIEIFKEGVSIEDLRASAKILWAEAQRLDAKRLPDRTAPSGAKPPPSPPPAPAEKKEG